MKIWNAFVVTALALGVSSSAIAQSYSFSDLGTLGTSSQARGINDSGQIAGSFANHTTLWNGTAKADLGTLGGSLSAGKAINSLGQVAGYSYTSGDAAYHATVWNGTTMIDLGTMGGSNSIATGINNIGQVVGYSDNNRAFLWNGTVATDLGQGYAMAINNLGQVTGMSSSSRATVWNGTTATELGSIGGGFSAGYAINSFGQVAGAANTATEATHATLWNGTSAIDLGTLDGTSSSYALGINDAGLVVGYAFLSLGGTHAFLWDGAAMRDLNSFLDASTVSAGWVLNIANGLNNRGDIVGNAYNTISGDQHGFLLTYTAPAIAPIPEPETYAMMLAGLGLIGLARRRKQKA